MDLPGGVFFAFYEPLDSQQSSNELTQDSRLNRDLDSLINERNGNQEETDKSLYSFIFSQIRNKLFSSEIDDTSPLLTPEQIEVFEKKYCTSELANSINRVKKLLVNNFNKKIELEIQIDNNKKKFKEFCKNITCSLKSIDDFSSEAEDLQLKELLSARIDWYYSKLEIDSLKKQHSEIMSEYSFFKGLLRSISQISPCGICQICMENQVEYFIDPCGHTICNICNIKSKVISCPFCRTHINSLKKVFL